MKFVLVDDHKSFLDLAEEVVGGDGHETIAVNEPGLAYETIVEQQPECVLLDIMMPEVDGLDLCRRLRQETDIPGLKIIMVTGRGYDFDRRRALELGADGFVTKPIDPETFMGEIYRIVSDDLTLTFWGVRGTLPLPGPNSLRYGGNTSCVSLALPKDRFFIFDAGSGIKTLSDSLMAGPDDRVEATIFISHPHWDHYQRTALFCAALPSGQSFRYLRYRSRRHQSERSGVGANGQCLFPGHGSRIWRQCRVPRDWRGHTRGERSHRKIDVSKSSWELPGVSRRIRRALYMLCHRQRAISEKL